LLPFQPAGRSPEDKEADMDITWQRDIDAALREAEQTGRPLLLDFTAAPM
jgi:hypothetical protein